MKQLIILLAITLSSLFAQTENANYITYTEFLKIKSYFSEDGCAGIEKFLQSSKDLNVSEEIEIKNMIYGDLCLLAGSTEFTALGGEKKADGFSYKNSWFNKFPTDKKVSVIYFGLPSKTLNKCKNHNDRFSIRYQKYEGILIRDIVDNDDLDDYSHADTECLLRQFPIFKAKPRLAIVKSLSKNIVSVKDDMYPDAKQRDTISIGQKVRILGSIGKLSYVYYNKKTKGACDPLKMLDGCNSGWVLTSLIAENTQIQASTATTPTKLSFEQGKQSISSFLPPKNDYEKKVVRNLPYAIKGYIFQDQKVQAFYESQNWYVANKNYRPDPSMLTESERQWINQWE